LVQRTFFYCADDKDVSGRMSATQRAEVNDDEHSLFMALNWSLLRIMCVKKGLNPVFRLREASEVLHFRSA